MVLCRFVLAVKGCRGTRTMGWLRKGRWMGGEEQGNGCWTVDWVLPGFTGLASRSIHATHKLDCTRTAPCFAANSGVLLSRGDATRTLLAAAAAALTTQQPRCTAAPPCLGPPPSSGVAAVVLDGCGVRVRRRNVGVCLCVGNRAKALLCMWRSSGKGSAQRVESGQAGWPHDPRVRSAERPLFDAPSGQLL